MLHNEARNLLVEAYEKTHDAKGVALAYGVSVPSVYRLAEQKARTGSVDLRVSKRGRKRVLGQEDLKNIARAVDEQPDITLAEIVEKLDLPVGIETVRRRLQAMGYRRKKKMIHASEQERPRCVGKERRMEWVSEENPGSHLVFLDESGVNINMARRYGRGKGGRRVVDHTPLNTPKSTTILSPIRLDGQLAFTTFQGGTTGDKFLTYLKDVLIPTLHPGDIVVMDNLRTHHIQAVSELLHGAGAQVLYLPPYSPDLNPIDKLWSKVKAVLRKLRVRSSNALDAAIRFALDQVSADDCAGWFSCAGYCLF